jgi:DNA-binding IclR family transcriptional regulator
VVDPTELRRILADIRRTGVVIAHEQITLHAVAVAAPVRGPRNDVIAAISAVVAKDETPLHGLAARLTDTANAISHALGAPGPSRDPSRGNGSGERARPVTAAA